MAEKKPAIRSAKTPKATQSYKARALASSGATAPQITKSARVIALPKGRKSKQNQPPQEPQAAESLYNVQDSTGEPHVDVDRRVADQIASTEVVMHLEPTTPQEPAPASFLSGKIAYLRSLLVDGNEQALQDALQRGVVKVQVPGATRTRRARRDASERPKTRKVFAPELVRTVRTLRSAGHSYAQCEVLAGMKPDKGRTSWMIVNNYDGPEA